MKALVYEFKYNPYTLFYDKQDLHKPGDRVPDELKLEEVFKPEIIKASKVLEGRLVNGNRTYFTGLRPVGNHWFEGNEKRFTRTGRRVTSLNLVKLSSDCKTFKLFYFPGRNPKGRKKEIFIREFIEEGKREAKGLSFLVQNINHGNYD